MMFVDLISNYIKDIVKFEWFYLVILDSFKLECLGIILNVFM